VVVIADKRERLTDKRPNFPTNG